MSPRRILCPLAALGALGLAPALPACNTVAGLGRDLQAAGGGIVGSSAAARQGRAAPRVTAQRDHATPEEVVAKVREAARYLAETGEKGLARFKGKGSEYVWKDTYVFVSDCDKRTIVAHPIMPERDGKPIAAGPTYGGITAAQRADAQCAAARKPGGGWFEYPFPKPGEKEPSRKVTYMLAVPGTPYVVGAGVYDETATLEQLQAVSGE
jgi:predicted small secreted protein